jgi:hypothetical protein
MKKVLSFFIAFFCAFAAFAQKNFEGVLVYRDNVVSKMDGVSNTTWKKILHLSDQITVFVKDGNFRHTSAITDSYVFPTKGRSYYKFKGYDTLYYVNTATDTAALISVTKNADKKMIAGYSCNSITIKTSEATYTYFYSAAIYTNPERTQNYHKERQDVFYKETSSLFLGLQQETAYYTYSESCIQVEQKAVDAGNFELPSLPQKELTAGSFLKYPAYKGKEGWNFFLNKNLDASLAAKYIKMKRSEDSVSQTAIVEFMVSETGNVYNASVMNKRDVHPKLAEEAIRVVNISHWLPATVFGDAIPYKLQQPITFQVVKE